MPGSPTVKFFKLVAATLVLAVAQLTWATDALLRIPGGLRWVSTGSETKVWGVGPTGRVYQFLNERWVRRPGTLAQLSVGIDGELWGVTDAQRVFRWDGRDWRRISGGLKQVAVGSAEHVWGLGPTGWVFQRVNDRWSRRPGTLTQLSVGADGTVWGLDEQHRALRWAGGDWEQVAAVFKSISVSDQNNVWGVGGRGELFRLTADGFQLERRKDAIRQISSAADGSVWVVNDQQEVFTWRTRYEWVATIAGEPRRAIVWAPRAHLGNPAPVVLFFHGRGNGLVSSEPGREFHRRWPEAYVVYGEGTYTFDDRSGIGWELRFPHLFYSCGRRTDLDYFDALLDHLEQEQNVDLNRVYVAGHSSGGFFTFSLAELRADRIRAVAVNGAYPSYVPVAVHIDCGNTYRDAIGVRFAGNNPTAASVAVARGQLRKIKRQPVPTLFVFGKEESTLYANNAWFYNANCKRFTYFQNAITQLNRKNSSGPEKCSASNFMTTLERQVFNAFGPKGVLTEVHIHGGGHSWPPQGNKWVIDFFKRN